MTQPVSPIMQTSVSAVNEPTPHLDHPLGLGASDLFASENALLGDEPDEISLQDLQAKAALDLIRETRDRFASAGTFSVSSTSSLAFTTHLILGVWSRSN